MTNLTPPCQKPSGRGVPRRTVLIGGAAIAAADLPTTILRGSTENGSSIEAAILSIVRHRHDAAALGYAVLSSWPHLGDRNQILASLIDDLGIGSKAAALANASKIAKRLSLRIYEDFATERTLVTHGWILSLAETRLYALAALAENT
jgi:hypothetical protein